MELDFYNFKKILVIYKQLVSPLTNSELPSSSLCDRILLVLKTFISKKIFPIIFSSKIILFMLNQVYNLL
jgi:hypothetical protein